jgi:hypothetical protein
LVGVYRDKVAAMLSGLPNDCGARIAWTRGVTELLVPARGAYDNGRFQ